MLRSQKFNSKSSPPSTSSSTPHKSIKSSRTIAAKRSPTKTKLHTLSPLSSSRSTFSTDSPAQLTPSDAAQQSPAQARKLDPIQRFQSRNAFIRKRHLQKDHLIHTHHNDVRIFACNLTDTLKLAVQKHKMSLHEAEVWGGYAAGTALYAGLLRGDDRVIVEAFLNNKEEQTNHIYVEAFAVGEIRGFSTIKTPDIDEEGRKHPGKGVIRLTKALYQHKRKYQSTLPATGDPMEDWQMVYSQSEQIPTYLQTETWVDLDENGQVQVEFCGATLIQVLGGTATQSEKVRILAEKKLRRNEEETDDEYVKRVQLFEYRNRVVDEDMPTIVKTHGAAGYVSKLIGLDPIKLGNPDGIHNIGNVDREFDFELFERSLLQSALRDKPLANVIRAETGEPVTELMLQEGKHQYSLEYRPLQFFCRCYQTDTHAKLISLPTELLTTLLSDESVTFTCDFCSLEDEILRDQIQTAIDAKNEAEAKFAETAALAASQQNSEHAQLATNVGEVQPPAKPTHVHSSDCKH